MKISIAQAKRWREEIGATHIVIFAVDPDGTQHVATHGETAQDAQEAAKAGNKLKAALGWPEDLCQSKPLERICKNCTFYKPDYGIFCVNGWSGDGLKGLCLADPKPVATNSDSKCSIFEPRG